MEKFSYKKERERRIMLFRERHSAEVRKYMRMVYNPMYYNVKPRFKRPMTAEEQKTFKKAMKSLYNPSIEEKNDIFDELGIPRMAEA